MILSTALKLQGSGELFLSPLRSGLSGGPPAAPTNAGLSESFSEFTPRQQSSKSEGTLWSLDTVDGRQQATMYGTPVSEHSWSGPASTRSHHAHGSHDDQQHHHAQQQWQHQGQHPQQQQKQESMRSPYPGPYNPTLQVLSPDSGSRELFHWTCDLPLPDWETL